MSRYLVFVLLFFATFLFTTHAAFAAPVTVAWDGAHALYDGDVNPFFPTLPIIATVTDPTLAGNSVTDKINVLVNSTSYPAGITMTLTESGDTGIFQDTDIFFTNGTGEAKAGDSVIIGIHKDSLNTDPTRVEFVNSTFFSSEGIIVFSTSDTNGITMNLTETGPNTGIFTNTLHLTTGPSVDGSAISVHDGDIVTIFNENNLDVENLLVVPNANPALGALPAQYNDLISVIYKGVKDTTIINQGFSPGGGGGGLIRPSLVLDFVAGGGAEFVSPPSFGGSYYHYSDGLTFTQGKNTTTFDTSLYNQELPRQVMIPGTPVNMTFKTFEAYNPEKGVIGMTLYIIPRGQDFNMDASDSIASIEWKNGTPVEVDDPNHILSGANASSNTDGKFQYTQFSFTPAKSYDKMSFLARAWNDHLGTTEVRVHDDLNPPPPLKSLPTGVVKYDNFNDLQKALEKDGFSKPMIMNHIHDTNAVFTSSEGGNVYWLYDTIKHTVTLVISDNNDNNLYSYQALLQPYAVEKKGDYKFMYFTVDQLNRWNENKEQQAMDAEAEKAMALAQEKGITPHSNWEYYLSH